MKNKKERTFWDFCAPFYDFAERRNGRAYAEMVKTVREVVPSGASVLEIAAGTGAISLAVADEAKNVHCTDISEKMLNVAKKKARKRKTTNISFGNINIFNIGLQDDAFDVVVASQVLHLIDEPEKAAAELRRVAKNMIILPISFTKNLRGIAKFYVSIYRLFGFAPKREFNADDYTKFLPTIGFDNCEFIHIHGKIPMIVAIYRLAKGGESDV